MPVTGFTKRNKGAAVVGVAGGSGSGKTYFACAVQKVLGEDRCAIVYQDSFYIDQSARFDFDGGSVNFDHPDSLDFDLLAQQLRNLKNGAGAAIPVYDFVTHSRRSESDLLEPRPVVLVDGTLIFHNPMVRELFDDLVFFDTPEDLRFQRRLQRDVRERGRTADGVRKQFYSQVKPMHDVFVEPSKQHARLVVRDEGDFTAFVERYCAELRAKN